MNWVSASKDCSSRANIWLKVAASRLNSLPPGGTATRADRSEAWLMASAVAVMCSRGRKARRAIQYPPTAASRRNRGRDTAATHSRAGMLWAPAGTSSRPRTHRPSSQPAGTQKSRT